MELQALALLLLSALVHAVWNFLSKRSLDKQAFLWLALVVVSVLFWPVLFFYPLPSSTGWIFIGVSGVLEAAYFLLLGGAYQQGDLSLVYPLVRGSAPLFVTFFAVTLLREKIFAGAALGILFIVIGIYVLHLTSLSWKGLLLPLESLRQRPSQLGLLTGLATAASVVTDKVGVTYTSPILYLYLVFVVSCVLMLPFMLWARAKPVREEWRVNLPSVAAVGIMFTASYSLVLLALTTSKVSYVSPIREISVVFGALLGTLALREPFAPSKVGGSALIFAGIVMISLAR